MSNEKEIHDAKQKEFRVEIDVSEEFLRQQREYRRAVDLLHAVAQKHIDTGNLGVILQTFSKMDSIDIDVAWAIHTLDRYNLVTKEALDVITTDSNPTEAVYEIVHGIENLKKLEKYGMNTLENRTAVILTGQNAIQTSLDLWEKSKPEIRAAMQATARKHESSSLYGNPAARYGARAHVGQQVKAQLEQVSAELHRPPEKPSPPPSPSKGG